MLGRYRVLITGPAFVDPLVPRNTGCGVRSLLSRAACTACIQCTQDSWLQPVQHREELVYGNRFGRRSGSSCSTGRSGRPASSSRTRSPFQFFQLPSEPTRSHSIYRDLASILGRILRYSNVRPTCHDTLHPNVRPRSDRLLVAVLPRCLRVMICPTNSITLYQLALFLIQPSGADT